MPPVSTAPTRKRKKPVDPNAPLTLDAILAKLARGLKPGETASIPLYKGPISTTTVDAVKAARAAAAEKRASSGAGLSGAVMNARGALKSTEEVFPKVAKFIETVSKPNFAGELREGRMFHSDIPKIKDDEDEDDPSLRSDAALAEGKSASSDPNAAGAGGAAPRPKKKRWKRNQPPKRHWLLLSNNEWVQKSRHIKLKSIDPDRAAEMEKIMLTQQSNRYEGLAESNNSRYVLFRPNNATQSTAHDASTPTNGGTTPSITVTTINGFVSFTQPAKYHCLTMEDAEQKIKSQREAKTSGVRARLLQKAEATSNVDDAEDDSGKEPSSTTGLPGSSDGKSSSSATLTKKRPKHSTSRRAHDPDDVMADLSFRNTKGTGGTSRKELINSLGDANLTVDHEGILGGANDSEFGGRRRFGMFSRSDPRVSGGGGEEDGAASSAAGGGGQKSASGNAVAMEDNFFKRDVAAEYDEMDLNANELFDNDDVDIGEGDIDDGDIGGGHHDDIDDDVVSSDDDPDDSDDDRGAAKAWRGLWTGKEEPGSGAPIQGQPAPGGAGDASEDTKPDLPVANVMPSPQPPFKKPKPPNNIMPVDMNAPPEVDANGDRILTQATIRREIWLHSGQIPFKKLKANFNIKKALPERTKKFVKFCKELCTVRKDPIEGTLMVLKQHYQK